jgi:hypothetical protein
MDQNIIDAGTQNFNLPHDIVQLPSQGIFYKSKKKVVKVGYLTANDENFIVAAFQGDKDNLIISLLRNKLYEHDLRPEDLIDGDVEAILIFLRNTSFGPEYNVQLTDPKTSKPFVHTEILDELNIKQTQFKPEDDGLFSVQLPKTGTMVKLRILTFSDTIDIDKMVESYPAGRTAPRVTWRLEKQIVEVDGNRDKNMIREFVQNMRLRDSKELKEYSTKIESGIDLDLEVGTPGGGSVKTFLPLNIKFFWPNFSV